MMNLKTSALLGNLTRQNVSRQLMMPASANSKTSVINLTTRTAQPVSANTPTNPVRSFSSTQANRDNNNNSGLQHQLHHSHGPQSAFATHLGHLSSHSPASARFQSPLTANLNFRKDLGKTSPKHSQLSKDAWDAINGQDARAVFPFLQEMRHEGFYADSALSNRIIAQFLRQNCPQDAERALIMLVDCHGGKGKALSASQKSTYTSLAKDIANHSSDFTQALSLAKLLDRHGLLASSGLADDTLKSYRQFKSKSGLQAVKGKITSADIETLLNLQASLTMTNTRYKHLIEILQDAKELNIIPSMASCSKVSQSFMRLDDYTGQLAWDTAVQEIYPGYTATTASEDKTKEELHMRQERTQTESESQPQQQSNSQHPQQRREGSRGSNNNNNNNNNRTSANDPSEAIIRACRTGYATVAMEGLQKMIQQNQLPSPQAIADTIQVCAKRQKERKTDYQELFRWATASVDAIQDRSQRRAAEYEVLNAMLVANATIGDMPLAKKNYDDIVRLGQFPDATGYATLLIATTTGAVDEAHDALRILDEVRRHRVKPNIFFYNVVIGKLSRGRKIEKVLEVYEEMVQQKIRPNAITYGTLISACTRVGSEDMAKNLFNEMVQSPNYNPRHGPHNAMIQFYVRQKKDRAQALHYYEDMLHRRLQPTEHTYTLLVEAFATLQPYDLTEANRLIQSLKRGPVRATENHYGALIHAYGVEHGDVSSAESVFFNMRQAGIVPRGPAYQSLIESFIIHGDVPRAVALRQELNETMGGAGSNAYIENTLIRGYGQAKDISAAEAIFEAMTDPLDASASTSGASSPSFSSSSSSSADSHGLIVKEPSTYQSMVSAYLENEMMDKAMETLRRMKSQKYPELVVKPVEDAIHAAIAAAASEEEDLLVAAA